MSRSQEIWKTLLPCKSHGRNLESEDEHQDSVNCDTSKAAEPVSSEKLHITPVLEATEEFLKTAFSPMENGPHRQLQHQFIVLNTPFTTPPHLVKFIVGKCSKSTKSGNHSFFNIQMYFLDAGGPLTGIPESTNGGTELATEEIESTVKDALTFWAMLLL